MLSDYDYRILHCREGNKFDILTWFWGVLLPLFVLIYASSPGWMRGEDLAEDPGLFAIKILPFGYIILHIAETKYLAKRIISATIWLLTLEVIWFELPLWFYLVYLSVPIAWYVNRRMNKRSQK